MFIEILIDKALPGFIIGVAEALLIIIVTVLRFGIPLLVQYLTLLNPMRYFLVLPRGVFLEGTSFQLLIPQFWPMAAIGVADLATAAWLFRYRMD